MGAAASAMYESELSAAGVAAARGEMEIAFGHLERAHIVSQRHMRRHVYVHWRMLRLGISSRDPREIAGQALRMLAAAIFSRLWVPAGNTGRANVSAFEPMPIPDDLAAMRELPSRPCDPSMKP